MARVLGSEVVTQLKAVIDVYIFKSSKAANLQPRESWTVKSQREVENQSRSTVMTEPPSSQMAFRALTKLVHRGNNGQGCGIVMLLSQHTQPSPVALFFKRSLISTKWIGAWRYRHGGGLQAQRKDRDRCEKDQ